jgi:putative transposon-encoded protein
MYILKMARKIQAIIGGKVHIEDDVEEIYEKKVTKYGNGAKVDAQKKYIGHRVYVIVLKDK